MNRRVLWVVEECDRIDGEWTALPEHIFFKENHAIDASYSLNFKLGDVAKFRVRQYTPSARSVRAKKKSDTKFDENVVR